MTISYEICAQGNTVYGRITDSNSVVHEISGTIASIPSVNFHYIVLTYNKNAASDQMKLYIDSELIDTIELTNDIATNTNDLIIGDYNSIIDETTTYSIALDEQTIQDHYLI